MSTTETTPPGSLQPRVGRAATANTPSLCSWMPDKHERKCQDRASHFHHAYGEVCPHHAAVLMAQGEKVARLLKHRTGVQSAITRRASAPNK